MNILKKANIAVRRVGLRNTLRFTSYALYRDWLERKYRPRRSKSPASLTPGSLLEAAEVPGGAFFRFEHASLEVIFLASDLARLSWGPGQPPIPYAIVKNEWPKLHIEVSQRGGGWILRSQALVIAVQADGSLAFSDPACGKQLRHTLPPVRTISPEKGNRENLEEIAWIERSKLPPDACIYGLGERAFSLNLRGGRFRMWNSDPPGGYRPGVDPLYLCIPVVLALHERGSYLVFYENPYPAVFSFGPGGEESDSLSEPEMPPDLAEARFEAGMLRYYFTPGPPACALERYTELTGRPQLPPRWSLGYHQSRWGYKSERDIRSVVEGFQKNDLPLSAVHLDIDYMDGFRVFTVDRERYPDLSRLAKDLDADGIRLVAIVNPGIKQDPHYDLYQEGLNSGLFCLNQDQKALQAHVWSGRTVFPDFTDPKVRTWWAAQYPRLLDQGIAGIWHDMNEPAAFTAWGELTLPRTTCHNLENRRGDHRQAHNLYGLLMNEAGQAGLRTFKPDRRPWLLSRSGWAGVARHAWSWTGDIETSWAALRQTISMLLGLGLSGVPFSGSDIGGFLGAPDAELYLRWFQMAAFTPFFRSHSAVETPRREPWLFGEPALSIVRSYLQLRARLMPYLYSLAWEASQTGHPLVRPLFWKQEDHRELWEVGDAFLLGDALLIAPVLEPGARSRRVLLPKGEWFNFWEDDRITGGAEIDLQAGLERIPVLVRAGSLLPLEEEKKLVLHIYPSGSGESRAFIYMDSGDGYGAWRVDRFRINSTQEHLEIAHSIEGAFPAPAAGIAIQLHGRQAVKTWVEGEEVTCEQNRIPLQGLDFKNLKVETCD